MYNGLLIDGVIVALLLVAIATGLRRGILREALSLLAWPLVLVWSIAHYEQLNQGFSELVADGFTRTWSLALIIVMTTAALLALIDLALRKLFWRHNRAGRDPLFGLMCGALRGTFAVTVVVILAHRTELPTRLDWYQSQFVGYAEGLALTIRPHLPAKVAEQIVLRDTVSGDRKITLPRDRRGHFIGKAWINGMPVEVLVDTGATMVMIPAHLAKHLDLTPQQSFPVNTATGQVTAQRVVIDAVKIGPILQHDVEAALVSTPKDIILIGMSFLLKTRFQHTRNGLLIEQARTSAES